MSFNEMFELIVMKVVSFLAMELTACAGNVLAAKILKLKKRIASRITRTKIHTGQQSGACLSIYVEFANI